MRREGERHADFTCLELPSLTTSQPHRSFQLSDLQNTFAFTAISIIRLPPGCGHSTMLGRSQNLSQAGDRGTSRLLVVDRQVDGGVRSRTRPSASTPRHAKISRSTSVADLRAYHLMFHMCCSAHHELKTSDLPRPIAPVRFTAQYFSDAQPYRAAEAIVGLVSPCIIRRILDGI